MHARLAVDMMINAVRTVTEGSLGRAGVLCDMHVRHSLEKSDSIIDPASESGAVISSTGKVPPEAVSCLDDLLIKFEKDKLDSAVSDETRLTLLLQALIR